jgi:hypothetical protein
MTTPLNQDGISRWLNHQQQEYHRKLAAWQKATLIPGYDASQVRRDAYGTTILWKDYGQTTAFGWEIDHELPKAHFPLNAGQSANLRALHWRNNRAKSDKIDLSTLNRLLGGA